MITGALVIVGLYFGREVLIPFVLAVLAAFVLAPMVSRAERLGIRRAGAILLVSVVSFGTVAGLGWIVFEQMYSLSQSLPSYEANIREKVEALRGQSLGFRRIAATLRGISHELTVVAPAPTTQPHTKPAETQIGGAPPRPSEVTVHVAPGGTDVSPLPSPAGDQTLGPTVDVTAKTGSRKAPAAATAPGAQGEPMPVQIVAAPAGPVDLLRATIAPVLSLMTSTVIIVVFSLFMLMHREDLRDRLISLTGRAHMTVTAQALDEAAARVSRFLVSQLLMNSAVALLLGAGLFAIGIPNALLWGLTAGVLRFVPYVGIWIAAMGPILMALAIFPGWTFVSLTIVLFIVLELVVANFVEPLLYGKRTGLSPLAVLVAAVFWTWLWGGVGLVLSTPLTVCIVVLGKYLPHMEFLGVMLGDEPVLSPPTRFYLRLLALDQEEAVSLAEEAVSEGTPAEVYDGMLLPALVLLNDEARRGQVERDRAVQARESFREILEDMADFKPERKAGEKADTREEAGERAEAPEREIATAAAKPEGPTLGQSLLQGKAAGLQSEEIQARSSGGLVACLGARSEDDQIAGMMAAQVMRAGGLNAAALPSVEENSERVDSIDPAKTRAVFIAALGPAGPARARRLCHSLHERHPQLPVFVGLWGNPAGPEPAATRLREAGAAKVVTSLAQATSEAQGAPVK